MADSSLYFWHPAVQRQFPSDAPSNTLIVASGANSIKWGYSLNTNKVPTYGGEVVQILSAQITPLKISGLATSKIQLEEIYKWFRAYMTLAGVNAHNQIPIKFQYPERGWELGIFVTSAPSFTLDRDQAAATWQITAEVEQDDKALIQDIVMQPLNYAMPAALTNPNILPFGITFTRRNRFSEYLPQNTNISDDNLNQWFEQNANITANNIGNNFQSLVASWAGGDFAHFVLDPTSTPASNGLTDADKIWQKLYNSVNVDGSSPTTGTPVVGSSGGNNNTGSLETLSGTISPEQAAALLVAAGFPSDEETLTVGVAIAYGESTLNVAADNHICCVGLWQINLSPSPSGLGGAYRSGTYNGWTYDQLTTNPLLNAKAALIKFKGAGNSWGTKLGNPWQAYGGPAYNGYVESTARPAVKRYLANPTAYNGTGGSGATAVGNFAYPLGTHGSIGQRPNAPGGTHSPPGGPANWESCNAIDISIPFGTEVYAVTDGTIGTQIGLLPGTGNTATLPRGSQLFNGQFGGLRVSLFGSTNAWYYAHLSQLTVTAGEAVNKGQLIGRSGMANGVEHLHFAQETGDPGVTVGDPSPGYSDRHYPS